MAMGIRLFGLSLIVVTAIGCGETSYVPRVRNTGADDEDETPAAAPAVAPAKGSPAAAAKSQVTASRDKAGTAGASPTGPVDWRDPLALLPADAKLTEVEIRERVILQLSKIHAAFETFRNRASSYPNRATIDRNTNRPGLSWRVLLLPSLGPKEKELYSRFRLGEPWNSLHNQELLKEIPGIYQSPHRRDEKTNFLMVSGAGTVSSGVDGITPETCPDGLQNTVVLVEASDSHARPWTQPDDYVFTPENVQFDLFSLRKDGCFAMFGLATGVRFLPANLDDEPLKAIFTIAGSEPFLGTNVGRLPMPQVDQAIVAALEKQPQGKRFVAKAETAMPPMAEAASVTKSDAVSATEKNAPKNVLPDLSIEPQDARLPLPSDAEIAEAAALMKKIYGAELEAARTPDARRQFAKKLLLDAKKLGLDIAGQYVILRAARDVATQVGDIETALTAIDQLAAIFQLDALPQSLKVLEKGAATMESAQEATKFLERAGSVYQLALKKDDFTVAKQVLTMSMGLAKRLGRRELIADVTQTLDELQNLKKAHAEISDDVLVLLRSPGDAAANAAVGRYLCFTKREWEQGLPMLMRGDHVELRKLAQDELQLDSASSVGAEIAERWWNFSDKLSSPREQMSCRIHAVHWYQKSLPQIALGLPRVLAEKRIEEMRRVPGAMLTLHAKTASVATDD